MRGIAADFWVPLGYGVLKNPSGVAGAGVAGATGDGSGQSLSGVTPCSWACHEWATANCGGQATRRARGTRAKTANNTDGPDRLAYRGPTSSSFLGWVRSDGRVIFALQRTGPLRRFLVT